MDIQNLFELQQMKEDLLKKSRREIETAEIEVINLANGKSKKIKLVRYHKFLGWQDETGRKYPDSYVALGRVYTIETKLS